MGIMKPTPRERAKAMKIAALEYARKRIASKDDEFVCIALNNWHEQIGSDKSRAIQRGLRNEIESRIAPWETVTTWLCFERRISYPNFDQGRAYRVRWIDSMIDEVKAGTL